MFIPDNKVDMMRVYIFEEIKNMKHRDSNVNHKAYASNPPKRKSNNTQPSKPVHSSQNTSKPNTNQPHILLGTLGEYLTPQHVLPNTYKCKLQVGMHSVDGSITISKYQNSRLFPLIACYISKYNQTLDNTIRNTIYNKKTNELEKEVDASIDDLINSLGKLNNNDQDDIPRIVEILSILPTPNKSYKGNWQQKINDIDKMSKQSPLTHEFIDYFLNHTFIWLNEPHKQTDGMICKAENDYRVTMFTQDYLVWVVKGNNNNYYMTEITQLSDRDVVYDRLIKHNKHANANERLQDINFKNNHVNYYAPNQIVCYSILSFYRIQCSEYSTIIVPCASVDYNLIRCVVVHMIVFT